MDPQNAATSGRAAAVLAAALIWGPGAPEDQVTATARRFAAMILGVRLDVTTDPWTWRQGGFPARPARRTVITERGTVQLHDDEQVQVRIRAKDAKGFVVPGETFTFTPGDPAVVTTQPGTPDADGWMTCVMLAGIVGSTTVDISDAGVTFHYTWAIDVVPAEVATVEVEEGTPEHQPGF